MSSIPGIGKVSENSSTSILKVSISILKSWNATALKSTIFGPDFFCISFAKTIPIKTKKKKNYLFFWINLCTVSHAK